MMNRLISSLLGILISMSVSLAGYSDGFITAGEYETGVEIFGNEVLIVNGGGADMIDAWNFSKLEIWSTSMPLGIDLGGVYDIHLNDQSSLLYLSGAADAITLRENSIAILKGGQINYIRSYQTVGWLNWEPVGQHIEMVVKDWTPPVNNILTGHWGDGSAFSITLLNQTGYDKVIDNIKFTIIPEPATLALLGIGGLLFRNIKQRLVLSWLQKSYILIKEQIWRFTSLLQFSAFVVWGDRNSC